MTQTEIPIPAQPARITLHKARAIRDQLEKQLHAERPHVAAEVTAIALRFNAAEKIYHELRPHFYGRKLTLDLLRVTALYIAALERKR